MQRRNRALHGLDVGHQLPQPAHAQRALGRAQGRRLRASVQNRDGRLLRHDHQLRPHGQPHLHRPQALLRRRGRRAVHICLHLLQPDPQCFQSQPLEYLHRK